MAGIPTNGVVSSDGSSATTNPTQGTETPSIFDLGDFGVVGGVLNSLARLETLTEENVRALLSGQFTFPTIVDLLNMLWDGLDTLLSLPVAIIKAILERLIPQELFDIFKPLLNILTGITGWGEINNMAQLLALIDKMGSWLWGNIRFIVTGFAQGADWLGGAAGTLLQQLVKRMTGLSVSILTDPLGALGTFFSGFAADGTAFLAQIISKITGVPVASLSNPLNVLGSFFQGFVVNAGSLLQQIISKITGIPISSLADPLDALSTFFNGFIANAGTLLQQIVSNITGTAVSALTNPLSYLNNFFNSTGIGTLFQKIADLIEAAIVKAFTGRDGGKYSDLVPKLPTIDDLVHTILGTTPDGIHAPDLGSLGSFFNSILHLGSPVPAENIIGTIPGTVLGQIPVGNIGLFQPNLLTVSRFQNAANLSAADGWEWDSVTTYDNDTGAVRFNPAVAGNRNLVADQDIPVSPGDKIEVSARVRTSSDYIGLGTPIQLFLVPFNGQTQLSPVAATSSGGSTPTPRGSTSNSWAEMVGTYTVPNSGVTSVRFMIQVGTSAYGGYIWFDDFSLSKTGLLGRSLVPDIGSFIDNALVTTATQFGTLVQNAVKGIDQIGQAVADAINGVFNPPPPPSTLTNWSPPEYRSVSGNVRNLVTTTTRGIQGKTNPIRVPIPGVMGASLLTDPPPFTVSVDDIGTSAIALTASLAGLSKAFVDRANTIARRYNGNAYTLDFASRSASSSLPYPFAQTYGLISASSTSGTFSAAAGTGTGYLGVSGGTAQVFNTSATGDNRDCIAICSLQTQTEYQKCGIFCSTTPDNIVTGGTSNPAYNYIIVRSDSTGANCVYAKLGETSCEIWKSVSNTHTRLAAYAGNFRFKAGSSYWLVSGDYGLTKRFTVYENDNPILAVDDATVPTTNLYSGFGASWKTFDYIGYSVSSLPAKVLAWTAYDNTPNSTKLGCGASAARSGTGTITLSGTNSVFPSGFWALTRAAGDIYTSSVGYLGDVGINVSGWYMVTCRVGLTGASGTANSLQLRASGDDDTTLDYDSSTVARGPISPSVSTSAIQASWIVYLRKGEKIRPAYTLGGGTVVNSSDQTYMHVAFMNNTDQTDDSATVSNAPGGGAGAGGGPNFSAGYSYADEWVPVAVDPGAGG